MCNGKPYYLETMRRSVSIHKTDADYTDQTRKQAMHHSFFQWLPYFGTLIIGQGCNKENANQYDFRSGNIPWFAYSYDVRKSAEENDYATGVAALKEWRDTNMFF